MRKGIQAFSAVLITGVMLGVVGSVYFWGLPLIEKNRDIATLENSERFAHELNDKIKYIANHGGRDRLQISVPGTVIFDNRSNSVRLAINTKGSIYVPGLISLSRNSCTMTRGIWGTDEPSSLCVETKQVDTVMEHDYRLTFITLDTPGILSYRIELIGGNATGSEQRSIIIESAGSATTTASGRDVTRTFVRIGIE
ncbi:MAG: hypothetical protein HYY37_02295 [Candidatus Aenigmarchaeota archaeon]|nr:hypothetical protein [Candidatus Aenigmarchaeota archaeon]